MGVTKTQQILINAYLKNELQGETLQNFEKELETNPVLKEELVFQQSISKAAKLKAVKEAMAQARIHNLLQNKEQYPQLGSVQHNIKEARTINRKQERKQKRRRLLAFGAIAASVLLVLFCGWKQQLENKLDKDLVFAMEAKLPNVFEPTIIAAGPSSEIELSGAIEEFIKQKLKDMKKAHVEGRFEEVFIILKQLEARDYKPEQLLFYEAGLHAQSEDYEKSSELLNALIQENNDIEYDARWLSGLIYLKLDNTEKAKKEFEVLVKESTEYQNKAREKLKNHCLL